MRGGRRCLSPADDRPTGWLRDRVNKAHQHQAFVDAVGNETAAHREIIAWFRTLPLWADLGDIRVVHACWDPARIEWLESNWGRTSLGDEDFMRLAADSAARPDGRSSLGTTGFGVSLRSRGPRSPVSTGAR